MPKGKKSADATTPEATDVHAAVRSTLAALQHHADPKISEQMQRQFGIKGSVAQSAFGLRMADVQKVAKSIKKRGKANAEWNHALALALWETAQYEARMVAIYVDVPALVTPSQMDAWAKDFTDWAVCDTASFKLFDASPHAFAKVEKWSTSKHEFVKRAAFAILAGAALHDKDRPDDDFLPFFKIIEAAASDDRNFVKKGVSWALRGLGKRSTYLLKPAKACASKLAASSIPSERWIGKDALRDFK